MTPIDLRARQAPLKERFRREPEAARIADRVESLPSDLADPLRVRVGRPGVFEIAIGAHPKVGGAGELPCSGDVLAAALAGCQELTIRIVAASLGLELEEVKVEVTAGADLRGALGVDRAARVGIETLDVRARVRLKDGDPARAERLLQAAERYCVVLDTLRHPPVITTDIKVDGSRGATPA